MMTRIGQILICLVAILSLAATTASACTCDHHQHETVKAEEPSCHSHASAHSEAGPADLDEENCCLASGSDCVCADTRPRAFAKSEGLKLQKHFTPVPAEPVVIAVPPATETSDTGIHFDKPFYLCDSFYNLAPKRGPPIL
jgi:hypothetical protein